LNLHLLPLACVYLLGAWVLWPLGWYISLAYGLYAVISNLVFISTICACCANYGRPDCESGYGSVSARLVRRGRPGEFPSCFRRYIPLVAAGWALPALGGLAVLYRSMGSLRDLFFATVPLLVFSVVAFGVLPRSSRQSCERCAQRRNCPGARFTVGERGKAA
jgi:hypothetical protein